MWEPCLKYCFRPKATSRVGVRSYVKYTTLVYRLMKSTGIRTSNNLDIWGFILPGYAINFLLRLYILLGAVSMYLKFRIVYFASSY